MVTTQREMDEELGFIKNQEYQRKFYDSMMFLKVNDLENHIRNIEDRLVHSEQGLGFLLGEKAVNIPFESLNRRIIERDKIVSQNVDGWQECQKIVERTLEILNVWEGIDDIKIQTQYASVIIGKIDNLKKKEIISFDEVRKKVCTLLRNVIRLNFGVEVFTKEHILLLKEGFSSVIKMDIQKESLFQLNKKLRKAGLLTMPAWE